MTTLFTGAVSRNLLLKVALGLILPLVLILSAFTAVEYNRRRQTMLDNLAFLAAQTGQVIENGTQHEMLTRNLDGLQHMLDAISEDKTLQTIYLLDTSGRVVFAPRGVGVGEQLDNSNPTCQPCHRLPDAERPASVVVTLPDGQRIFRNMNSIENQPACQECHPANERLIGLLLTDISMVPLEEPLAEDLRDNLLWLGGTIAITILLVYTGLNRLVIRPLENVAHALTLFGEGHYEMRLPVESEDEVGQLAKTFNEMSQRLQSDEIEKRTLSENLRREASERRQLLKQLIYAQEEERKRVARDLHDGLCQDLAGLVISLETIERFSPRQPKLARNQIQQARRLVIETTQRAYEMILSLRPSVLDDLGLVPALRTHAERALKNTGIHFELNDSLLAQRLPSEIETALFRVFQEALNNIVRHASARSVSVSLRVSNQIFSGEIVDDGHGFDLNDVPLDGSDTRGLGLLGMRERVEQCGGTLEITSQPGGGACIRVKIPLLEMNDGQ